MRLLVIGAGTGDRMRKAAVAAKVPGADSAIELGGIGAAQVRLEIRRQPVGAVLVVGPLWTVGPSGTAAPTREGVEAERYRRGAYRVFWAAEEGKRATELLNPLAPPPPPARKKRGARRESGRVA